MWNGVWPPHGLQQLLISLLELEKLVATQNPNVADDINQVLARFLVVRTCGYLEQAVEQSSLLYLNSKSSHPRCQSFNETWFGHGRNPKPDALVSFVKRFDLQLADDLEALLKEEDHFLSREVSFLVDRRNKISHGLSEGVGVKKALDLVEPAIRVSDWFIRSFDPQ